MSAATECLADLYLRPMLRHRNEVAYITVRSWRADARAGELAAFKAEKMIKNSDILAEAATDLAGELGAVLGCPAGWFVTCIACGHSRDHECWGKCLARRVAVELGVEFIQVWADRFLSGVSHPKEFRKLPPLEWIARPAGPVIVVDDLVTSGWHLEEALGALRVEGIACLGAAWIGGTAGDGAEKPLPAWCADLGPLWGAAA